MQESARRQKRLFNLRRTPSKEEFRFYIRLYTILESSLVHYDADYHAQSLIAPNVQRTGPIAGDQVQKFV